MEHLPMVIDRLKSVGINFVKDRKVEPYISTIQFKRYIEFKQIGDGIYQDNHNDKRFFISLPKLIEFDKFLRIIQDIKQNCNFNLFDSFLTSLYYKDQILDFAGIYSHDCDKKRLPEFKKDLEKIINAL